VSWETGTEGSNPSLSAAHLKKLDLRHQVYEVPHFREKDQSDALPLLGRFFAQCKSLSLPGTASPPSWAADLEPL
jgi:hypothetical protein